ncbi:MAG TPA: hypothetical protein VN804_04160, partial [Solirubrobacteraceae bacterium]|nr:hypothetical protein [Solirubrobacteraceae bacterium]
MVGSFLSAWILFPCVLLLASVGCGLLVRRVAAGELSTLLLAPTGFALVVVICAFACSYGWLAEAAGPIVALAAVAGIALELRARKPRSTDGRARRATSAWVWALLAALAAFAAVGGPVFLTGQVGWTG